MSLITADTLVFDAFSFPPSVRASEISAVFKGRGACSANNLRIAQRTLIFKKAFLGTFGRAGTTTVEEPASPSISRKVVISRSMFATSCKVLACCCSKFFNACWYSSLLIMIFYAPLFRICAIMGELEITLERDPQSHRKFSFFSCTTSTRIERRIDKGMFAVLCSEVYHRMLWKSQHLFGRC